MDNKDSERYFVGSDGCAYIVSSQRYTSFRVDSRHFQKLCDGGWINAPVRRKIMRILRDRNMEVSDWEFDRMEMLKCRSSDLQQFVNSDGSKVERVRVSVNPPLFLTPKCGSEGEPFNDDGDPATEAFYRSQLTAARNLQHPNPIDAERSVLKHAEAAATVTPTCSDSMADAARRISAATIRQKFDTIDRFSREIAEHVAELDRIGWPAVRGNEREAFVDLTKRIEAWKKGWNW